MFQIKKYDYFLVIVFSFIFFFVLTKIYNEKKNVRELFTQTFQNFLHNVNEVACIKDETRIIHNSDNSLQCLNLCNATKDITWGEIDCSLCTGGTESIPKTGTVNKECVVFDDGKYKLLNKGDSFPSSVTHVCEDSCSRLVKTSSDTLTYTNSMYAGKVYTNGMHLYDDTKLVEGPYGQLGTPSRWRTGKYEHTPIKNRPPHLGDKTLNGHGQHLQISTDSVYMVSSQGKGRNKVSILVFKNQAKDPETDPPYYTLLADIGTEEGTTFPANVEFLGSFGSCNAISGDGKYIVVSGHGSSNTGTGSAYVLKRTSNDLGYEIYANLSTNNTINPPGNINGNNYSFTDLTMGYYGQSVHISHDGTYVVVTGQMNERDRKNKMGSIIFKNNGKSFDFYQIIQGEHTGAFITNQSKFNGDGSILIYSGGYHVGNGGTNGRERTQYNNGYRVYVRNDVYNKYESTQFDDMYNYTFGKAPNKMALDGSPLLDSSGNEIYEEQRYVQGPIAGMRVSYAGDYFVVHGQSSSNNRGGNNGSGVALVYVNNGDNTFRQLQDLTHNGDACKEFGIKYLISRPGYGNESHSNYGGSCAISVDARFIAISGVANQNVILIFKRNNEGVYKANFAYTSQYLEWYKTNQFNYSSNWGDSLTMPGDGRHLLTCNLNGAMGILAADDTGPVISAPIVTPLPESITINYIVGPPIQRNVAVVAYQSLANAMTTYCSLTLEVFFTPENYKDTINIEWGHTHNTGGNSHGSRRSCGFNRSTGSFSHEGDNSNNITTFKNLPTVPPGGEWMRIGIIGHALDIGDGRGTIPGRFWKFLVGDKVQAHESAYTNGNYNGNVQTSNQFGLIINTSSTNHVPIRKLALFRNNITDSEIKITDLSVTRPPGLIAYFPISGPTDNVDVIKGFKIETSLINWVADKESIRSILKADPPVQTGLGIYKFPGSPRNYNVASINYQSLANAMIGICSVTLDVFFTPENSKSAFYIDWGSYVPGHYGPSLRQFSFNRDTGQFHYHAHNWTLNYTFTNLTPVPAEGEWMRIGVTARPHSQYGCNFPNRHFDFIVGNQMGRATNYSGFGNDCKLAFKTGNQRGLQFSTNSEEKFFIKEISIYNTNMNGSDLETQKPGRIAYWSGNNTTDEMKGYLLKTVQTNIIRQGHDGTLPDARSGLKPDPPVQKTDTIFIVNNISTNTVVLWTNKFGYRNTSEEFNTNIKRSKHYGEINENNQPYYTHFINSLQAGLKIKYFPEEDSKIYFTQAGVQNMHLVNVTQPIPIESGIDLKKGITVISGNGQRYNFTNIENNFTEHDDAYLYAVVLNGPTIDIYKKGIWKRGQQFQGTLNHGPHVTVNADKN